MVLAIETATPVCSVALQHDNGSITEKRIEQRGSHSEYLFRFTEHLLDLAGISVGDLTAVAVSSGPGSYTGLRISATAVKGLLFGHDVPLFSVGTLTAIATSFAHLGEGRTVHSVIDARRNHLYHQMFAITDGLLVPRNEAKARSLEEIASLVKKGHRVVGTGTDRLPNEVAQRAVVEGSSRISARWIAELYRLASRSKAGSWKKFVESVDPETFDPKYLGSGQVAKK